MSIVDQPSANRQVPDADLEQAIRWCKAARNILKKPAIGSGKRGEMAAATKKVVELLAKLQTKRSQEYAKYRAEFLEIGEQAEAAGQNGSKTDVLDASARLSSLAKDITKVLARIKEVDAATAKYEHRIRDARIELTKGRGWRDATSPGSPVSTHLGEAESYCDLAESFVHLASTSLDISPLNGAKNSLESFAAEMTKAIEASHEAENRATQASKEMKQFAIAEQSAQDAAKELEVLVGADEQARTIREKLADARRKIRKEGELWLGYGEALEGLQGIDAILEEGRVANRTLLATQIPDEVQERFEELLAQLNKFAEVAPTSETDLFREQASRIADIGRMAPDRASNDLSELTATVRQRTLAKIGERDQAVASTEELERTLASCRSLNLGADAVQVAQRVHERAINAVLPQRRWAEAQRQTDAARRELEKWLDAYQDAGAEWEHTREKIREIVELASRGVLVSVCASEAGVLLDAAREVLAEFRTCDFQNALQAASAARVGKPKMTLEEAAKALANRLESLGTAIDDAEYWTEFSKSQGEVARAANAAKTSLADVVYGIGGLTTEQTHLLIQFWWERADQVVEQWRGLLDQIPGQVDRLIQERTLACTRLAGLSGEARLALRTTSVEQLLASVPVRETPEQKSRLVCQKKIDSLLLDLAGIGLDVSDEEAMWALMRDDEQANLGEFRSLLQRKLNVARGDQRKVQRQFLGELTSTILNPFYDLPVGVEFRNELERRAHDLTWMIESGDPDLVAVAYDDLNKLKLAINDIQNDGGLHKKNKERIGKVAKQLGLLMEALPETYRRLFDGLTDLKLEASRVSPQEAVGKIEAFEKLVAEAKDKAKAREIVEADYKQLKHDAVERLKKLKAFAAIDQGERGDAFLTYVEARIAEASGLKAREDGIDQAIELLQRLLQELKSIGAAKDKLQRLLELDSQQVNAQRLVRDMAQQFERRKSIFTGVTLPRVKAKLESSPDDVAETLDGFEKVASAAAKIVSPYLKVLKTLPHDKKGAQPSPDMKRLQADFDRAYAMLEGAERSALRMLDYAVSTNVSGPSADGLIRLEDKWRRRSAAYDAAVREIVASIFRATEDESDEVDKERSDEAVKLIERLAGRFDASAFTRSIRILTADRPESKTDQAADRRSRSAERESALRTMRQFRDELLSNPLLRRLADRGQNPFAADAMASAVAGLRATLKEIELQLLDSE